MILTNCGDCSGHVGTRALMCPHCGARRSGGRRGLVFLTIAAPVLILAVALACHEYQPGGALRTDQPLFATQGALLCATEEAATWRSHGDCVPAPETLPVSVLETRGFLRPVYRVQFDAAGAYGEAWAPGASLHN